MESLVTESYFAAANGYEGFRSYFADVFKSSDYNQIYVLKGGPGTGKSTLMKKVLNEFDSKKVKKECIYCSSDPKSLDAIILKYADKKVAIIDGTAPHERDAVIPGAIDSIVNLGCAWNKKVLEAKREKILELALKKSEHYKRAYAFLKISGIINGMLKEFMSNCYDNKKSKNIAIDTIEKIKNKKRGRNVYKLYSCFGKNGYKTIDAVMCFSQNIYVKGMYGSESFFMNDIKSAFSFYGISNVTHPSPFSEKLTEGVTADGVIISTLFPSDKTVDTSEFISQSKFSEISEDFFVLEQKYNESLTLSKNEFDKASKMHFQLEDIYSAAMDYDKNNELTEKIKSEIKELFNY